MARENLEIRITAEMQQIRAAITGLTDQLEKTRSKGKKIGTDTAAGVSQLNAKLTGTARIVQTIAATIGAGFSIAGLIRAADEASGISTSLKLATNNAQALATAQTGVFKIAQETRNSLLATTQLYARIERSTRDIGLNQSTILQLTKTINQAATLSGGGAAAEAALFQLSQGLASGVLRGDELNSVLEQTPRLAQAIADGMDIPIGQLRKIAQEGKLTSAELLKAILKQKDVIAGEAAQAPVTVAQGFTAIRNAIVQYLATNKDAQEAFRKLGEALMTIAQHMPAIINFLVKIVPVAAAAWAAMYARAAILGVLAGLAKIRVALIANAAAWQTLRLSAIGSLGAIRIALGVLVSAFAGWQIGKWLREEFLQARLFGLAFVSGMLKLWETLKGSFRATGVVLREAFYGAFNWVLDKAAGFARSMATALSKIPGVGDKASGLFVNMAKGIEDSKVSAEGVQAAFERVRGETQLAKDNIDGIIDGLVDAEIAAEAAKNAVAGTGDPLEVGTGAAVPGGDGKAAQAAAKMAAIQADLIRDNVERALKQLDRLYSAGKISIRDYFAEKTRLETEAIDASLAAARAELAAAKGGADVAAAQANIVKLMRDRKAVALDAIYAQKEAEDDLTRQIGQLHIRMLQATGETARATRAQLEEEMGDLIIRLQSEGDTAGVALARKVINLEAWQAQLDEAKRRVDEAMSKFQSVETSTGAQVEAGMLGQSDAEDRVKAQREASLEVLLRTRDTYIEVQEAARLAGDAMTEAAATEAIAELDGQIATLSINVESLGYKATQVLKGALSQLFTDLADGSKSASDSLKAFVLNFVQGMAQIAANALATYLVLQLLDAIYPGLGKMTAATASAGVHHAGGVVGAGGSRRTIPAFAFAGAPRYHTGGVAGLAANEVPAILQKGEEVLTAGDPRHRNNGGMGGKGGDPGTRFVFVDDQRDVSNYLESAEGERVVVRILERNKLSN